MEISTALTIGGSDTSCGAGIQADLKAFNNMDVNGCSVITCITAQNTRGVSHIEGLSVHSIESQLKAILSDISIDSLKTGMLYKGEIIELVSTYLEGINVPRIIDPVMISRAGSQLIDNHAVELYRKCMLPKSSLLTPNVYEASLLSGVDISTKVDVTESAKKILDLGAEAVVIKCGAIKSLSGQDYLLGAQGFDQWLYSERIDTKHTHGSGCAFGAVVTACLSKKIELLTSIKSAKKYIGECIRHSLDIGYGAGPICQWKSVVPDVQN